MWHRCALKPKYPRRAAPMYVECMARHEEQALKRVRAAGLRASDLIRKGLRVIASRYYSGRRPPSTLLFESTNTKLGDEVELFWISRIDPSSYRRYRRPAPGLAPDTGWQAEIQ